MKQASFNALTSLRHVVLGAILSFLFIWVLSCVFVDSLVTIEYDKDLGFLVFSPNIKECHRSEGWAETTIGEHGLIGTQDVTDNNSSKIAIWGDSFVEAFQVNDNEKMGARVNASLRGLGFADLIAIQIGQSANTIADICYKLPRYEKIIPTLRAHYIVMGRLDRIFPEDGVLCRISFEPRISIVETGFQPQMQAVKNALYRFRLDFLWYLVREDILGKKLNLAPNLIKHSSGVNSPQTTTTFRSDVSGFLLDELRARTRLPVILIWCPTVPVIKNGSVVFDDEDADKVETIMTQCEKRGIKFINMSDAFSEFYRTQKLFVRGFPNSRPASGHLNAAGHNLVAKAITDSILSSEEIRCFSSN
jgi:lysophospholipase L1-like esterase